MKAELGWRITRFVITVTALFVVWLLFTASMKPFSLVMGLAGSVLIAVLTYDVFIARHDASLFFFMPRPLALVVFLFVLVFLIYQSSIRMCAAVFHGRVNPRIVHFRTRIRSDLGRMVLANAITLTPGTITLDLNDDHLTVHWFFCNTNHAKAAGEAVKGRIEKYLGKVWL
jgi:multicomponent Na+:H+ antiporter subunit E